MLEVILGKEGFPVQVVFQVLVGFPELVLFEVGRSSQALVVSRLQVRRPNASRRRR